MSDFRNNGSNDSAPIAQEEIRRDEIIGGQHGLNDNGGLSRFHHFDEEEEAGSRGKLIGGALVVALLLGAAGVYMYAGSTPATQTVAAVQPKAATSSMASNVPAPIQTAPATPPAQSDSTALANALMVQRLPPLRRARQDTASVQPESKPVKAARAHVRKEAQQKMADQNAAEIGSDGAAQPRGRPGHRQRLGARAAVLGAFLDREQCACRQ